MYKEGIVWDIRLWNDYLLLKVRISTDKPLPGQFFMIRDEDFPFHLPRPFSVFSWDEGTVSFLIKRKGRFTNHLAQKRPGDRLNLLGPLGNGFPESQKVLLVAGGIGIAPLDYYRKLFTGSNTRMLWGVPSKNDIVPWINLDGVSLATEDGSAGLKGSVLDLIPNHNLKSYDIILMCGPRAMIKRSKEILQGIDVYVSLEERMGCGLGLCYGCAVRTKNGYKRVCKEGPVFRLEEIIL